MLVSRGDEGDRQHRPSRGWPSAQQSRGEFAPAISTTRTSHAALSECEDTTKVQFNSRADPQSFQPGASSRDPRGLQTETLGCVGRVARPRGLATDRPSACHTIRRARVVTMTKPMRLLGEDAGRARVDRPFGCRPLDSQRGMRGGKSRPARRTSAPTIPSSPRRSRTSSASTWTLPSTRWSSRSTRRAKSRRSTASGSDAPHARPGPISSERYRAAADAAAPGRAKPSQCERVIGKRPIQHLRRNQHAIDQQAMRTRSSQLIGQ